MTQQEPAVPAQLSADQLNQAVPPGAAQQTEDAGFLKRKLELQAQDLRSKGESNARLNQQVTELQQQLKTLTEQAAHQKTATLEEQGQFKTLWENAQKDIANLRAEVARLEGELSSERDRNANEKLANEALALMAQQGVNAPDQLLTIVQAKHGLRRGESGQVEMIVGGTSLPLGDQLQQMRQTPEWQHHFSASGARGMGAAPSTSSVAPGVTNPWRKETFNWTQQLLLEQQNPELAEALKAEAARG